MSLGIWATTSSATTRWPEHRACNRAARGPLREPRSPYTPPPDPALVRQRWSGSVGPAGFEHATLAIAALWRWKQAVRIHRRLTPSTRRVAVLAEIITAGAMLLQCTAPPALADATVQPVTAAELGASWRPGCPVGPEQLRRVGVDHIGFDGQTHRGQLIVHEELVSQVITIFEQLFQLRYPIEKIRTVDQYPAASDELQMEDNNSSAFSCRDIPGTGRWSEHAYGRAIDLSLIHI